jgi:hypothetical protein
MMNIERKIVRQLHWMFLVLLLFVGCAPLIGPYSPTAYQNATSLKVETLALMDKATQPYAGHEKEVESLNVEIDKAYEFVKGISSNSISAKQWLILKKPDGDLLGKFFLRWKERGVLSQAVIDEYKGVVSDAYDEIICLEANKKEATKCSATGGK